MTSINIKKAFELMCSDYLDMFKTHYPRASGGGLNEANQTYYFCKNLSFVLNERLSEQDIKSSVSLETPYGVQKRMDGVVVSPSTAEIFLIQAKRLKNSQTQHIIGDVKKAYNVKDDILNKVQLADKSISYKVYLVILADMWLHKSTSKGSIDRLSIPMWWLGEDSTELKRNFINNEFHHDLLAPKSYFTDEVPPELIWDNQLLHRFYDYKQGLAEKEVLSEYCLLCGHSEI
ncbi:hypothetical protein [Vibrio parahaemolyticus]|uniref:hypothetical protein n=1 Tax=Vibrio parahaemolyticus TaxID=670 RepID=UPI00226A5BEC|nr:hypothetical protein [Vibrio parahaemolyticus]MCX8892256.1 hypothetical protein [Vibrio parahaemolyticus]